MLSAKPIYSSLTKLAVLRGHHVSHVHAKLSTSSINSSQNQHKPRFNPLGIEMLPGKLYEQVFGSTTFWQHHTPHNFNLQKCIQHLKRHDLLPEVDTIYEHHKYQNETKTIGDIEMDIPKLQGHDINQHFHSLGKRYSDKYREMSFDIIENGQKVIEAMPKNWSAVPGWTRYEPQADGSHVVYQVDVPLESTLIFDVETCLSDTVKHAPTIAVALSTKAWYSWTSPRLLDNCDSHERFINRSDLIHFESSNRNEKLIIGHNVGFDRSFLSDQYDLQESKTKFLDTLSLHMCICGLTGLQRAFKVAQKRKKEDDPEIENDTENVAWIEKGSLNNLKDVYEFHCGCKMNKDDREIFIEGSMNDVRENYQSLMTYCANDVKATFDVFKTLFSTFSERFPHPVTLAGMLEMSTMYLPVDTNNWYRYIENSQQTFDEQEQKLSGSLQELANRACSMSEEEHSQDVWLWDVDWSTQSIKPNKTKMIVWERERCKSDPSVLPIEEQVEAIYETRALMRQKMPFLPGFPKWYRDLCCPASKATSLLEGKDWQPGPCLISTQMRITPRLMRLTWDGYPIHFNSKHGWGYLVPNDDPLAEYIQLPEDHPYRRFPIQELRKLCQDIPRSHLLLDDKLSDSPNLKEDWVRKEIEKLRDNTQISTANLIKELKKLTRKKKVAPRYKNDLCEDVDIPGAYFIKIPHKNGVNYNVGNPMGKDFIGKMEDGTLSSFNNDLAKELLRYSLSLSWWKNNHKRIKNQMVVGVRDEAGTQGAILPRVIVAGTVTRRAVEPTWLTASNQDTTRIGSELKAMIQAPNGYCFVGADVDSQELWIASLMGDSHSYKIHGGTGLSYMTLRGSKSDKTDMHSKTASLIGVSRSEAKVLNYARIYGAGQKFIERFLMNSNHHLKSEEAKEKAKTILQETKGIRKFYFLKSTISSAPGCDEKSSFNEDRCISIPADILTDHKDLQIDLDKGPNVSPKITKGRRANMRAFWEGGTESATFNKLEEIASSAEPRTPVLDCQISRALEPAQDEAQDFVTSRVNWVVQSSAVDFLHLVLVNMKWLFEQLGIDGRFSISIHDEVRYIVKEEDRYKAAFALQVSNLLVRAYFAYKLNMKDLPISVAFFSSVDIDKCLRKEVNMECKSPSNPFGLSVSHNVPPGESLGIKQILEKYTYNR